MDLVCKKKQNYQGFGLCYPFQPSADNKNLDLDKSCYLFNFIQ